MAKKPVPSAGRKAGGKGTPQPVPKAQGKAKQNGSKKKEKGPKVRLTASGAHYLCFSLDVHVALARCRYLSCTYIEHILRMQSFDGLIITTGMLGHLCMGFFGG